MKCTIPGANMKVIARAVQALARIGDELYVEPDINSMSFRSVNSSRSAYASFTFDRSFFAFYKHEPSQSVDTSQEENCKCKISMKSCLPVFRSPVTLDRKVENCMIRLEDDGSKLVFEMRFRHGISKTHFLPVIECETLQAVYTKDDSSNCLRAQAQLFQDTVHNFNNAQEEVTLAVTPQKTYLRSYVDGTMNSTKMKYTEISLDPAEFDKYVVKNETAITFCLKEFRALLTFADATGQNVEAYFESGGKPVVFGVKHETTYEASFVLSTLTPEVDAQTPTPQLLRDQNSSTPPVISAATVSKELTAQSNSKQDSSLKARTNSTRSTNNMLPRHTPELQQDIPQEINRMSVRRADSPSLLSAARSGRSLQNSAMSRTKQSSVLKSCQQLQNATETVKDINQEPTVNKKSITSQERRPSNVHGPNNSRTSSVPTSQKKRPSNVHGPNNRRTSSVPSQSDERTSRELSSVLHDMNTPPMMMSTASSDSLQLRESDEEDNDTVASSPQPVRKRPRLFDIFDSTFDPGTIPGHDIILAEDSGDEHV